MIFRAIFWIGLVARSHAARTRSGFRPSGGQRRAFPTRSRNGRKDKVETDLGGTANFCRDNASACAVSATLLDEVKATTLRNLAQVKADIAQNSGGRDSGS